VRATDVLPFLRDLCRHLPRGFTLIWDRSRTHRAVCVAKWLSQHARSIRVEWLPPYAPDLNPVEHVWGHTKHGDLANFTPDNIEELEGAVLDSFVRKRGKQRLLEGFIRAAGLEP
jgi:transposase